MPKNRIDNNHGNEDTGNLSLPKGVEIRVPLLKFLLNSYNNTGNLNQGYSNDPFYQYIVDEFHLTKEQQKIRNVIKDISYTAYKTNVRVAKQFLVDYGILTSSNSKKGEFLMTKLGLEIAQKAIEDNIDRIDANYLRIHFPKAIEYHHENEKNKKKDGKKSKAKATISEVEEDKRDKRNFPLNLILYGPPGTGKTFTLRTEYLDLFTEYTEEESLNESLQEFANRITWWEAEAIALLDIGESTVRHIIGHQLVSAKLAASKTKNELAKIWATIQPHTVLENQTIKADRQPPLIFYHTKQGNTAYWNMIHKSVLKEICPKLLNLKSEWEILKNKPVDSKSMYTNKRYDFVTFHQSFTYEDFIEGIKPVIPLPDDTCQNNETSLSGSAVSDQLEAEVIIQMYIIE